MMKEHFMRALNALKSMLLVLASDTEEALQLAIKAVKTNDIELAKQVIANDEKIDLDEIKIEEECLKILALYQVVATDLREVITVLKINNEIERVGDLAASIAARVEEIATFKDTEVEKIDLSDMVSRVTYMLKGALDAMTYHDGENAKLILRCDEEVNRLHRENIFNVQEMIVKYPNNSLYYMNYLSISRALERIGDIATNISEDVIYLEYGKIVRHAHYGE